MNIPTMEDIVQKLHQHTNCRTCNKSVSPRGYILTCKGGDPFAPVCNECNDKEEKDKEKAIMKVWLIGVGIILCAIVILTFAG